MMFALTVTHVATAATEIYLSDPGMNERDAKRALEGVRTEYPEGAWTSRIVALRNALLDTIALQRLDAARELAAEAGSSREAEAYLKDMLNILARY